VNLHLKSTIVYLLIGLGNNWNCQCEYMVTLTIVEKLEYVFLYHCRSSLVCNFIRKKLLFSIYHGSRLTIYYTTHLIQLCSSWKVFGLNFPYCFVISISVYLYDCMEYIKGFQTVSRDLKVGCVVLLYF